MPAALAPTAGPGSTGQSSSWLNVPVNQLKSYVSGSSAAGYSFSTMAGGSPSSSQGRDFIAALLRAGYSDQQIQRLAKGPSELQQLIDQLGMSTLIPPLGGVGAALAEGGAGAGAEGAAAGAAAGTTAGLSSSALQSLGGAAIFAGVWEWLTTASNWVRVLEYVGGAVLVYLGIKGLTGIEIGPGGKI